MFSSVINMLFWIWYLGVALVCIGEQFGVLVLEPCNCLQFT